MSKALDEITRVFSKGTLSSLSDRQLLERFVTERDGEAFAVIVARHGAMVLSVCRVALGPRDLADAEDAFQATFLVLVRRAGSFPLHGTLSGWLYRVARRVGRQVRVEASRRRARERLAVGRGELTPSHDPALEELRSLIHHELARLPERYRMPILLCDVQGFTRDQAAELIGCPPGTVAGRLARARGRLRDRLAQRGVDSSAAWSAVLLTPPQELSRLAEETTNAAVAAAHGEWAATSAAALLAARASRGLIAMWLPAVVAVLIALGIAGAATAVFGLRDDPAPEAPAASQPAPVPQAVPRTVIDPENPATADLFAGKVVDADGKPIEGVKIYLVPYEAYRRTQELTKAGPVRAITAAGGRFQFSAKDMTYTSLDGLPARRQGLLIATADGYGPDWVTTWGQTGSSFRSHSDPVKGAELTLTLTRDDVPIRGRLLGPDGGPLAGATVRLTELDIPRDRDLSAHLKTWTSPESLFMSLDYQRFMSTPSVLPGVTTEAVADVDGRFRLSGLGRERLAQLSIRGPGVADTLITVMTRDAPDVHYRHREATEDKVFYGAQFTLSLPRGRTVTGVVRDKMSGTPLADVWVGPGIQVISALETNQWPTATDARGRFALQGLSSNLIELSYSRAVDANRWEHEQIVLAVPKPGQPYFFAKGRVNEAGEAVVNCPRGIPYTLRLRDRDGRPVDAEVTYSVISPNDHFVKQIEYLQAQAGSPLSVAARQADGSYLGVALPGPGVVVAKTRRQAGYRPAFVDPKAFFAPGRTNWTPQDMITTYGTPNTLSVATFYGGAWVDQHDYTAIVLINPAEGAKPLDLVATVEPDRPRQVTLLDPEGRPVIGASTTGLTYHPWDHEPPLRVATFPVTGLHPDRARRITFLKEDRKLIGFLLARGDGDAPYTVRMQPWAVLAGRVVDAKGKPQPKASLATDPQHELAAYNDPRAGLITGVGADENGRFAIDRLVPGLSYSAALYKDQGRVSIPAFEGVVLAPGEVRDLGDIRIGVSTEPGPKP